MNDLNKFENAIPYVVAGDRFRLDASPLEAILHYSYAISLYDNDKYNKEEELDLELLVHARLWRGLTEYQIQHHQEARYDLDFVVQRASPSQFEQSLALALLHRGAIRRDHGEKQGAIEDFTRVIRECPNAHPTIVNDARGFRGSLLLGNGEVDTALQDFATVIEAGKELCNDVVWQLVSRNNAVTLMQLEKYESALTAWELILEENSLHSTEALAQARWNRFICIIELDQWTAEAALEIIKNDRYLKGDRWWHAITELCMCRILEAKWSEAYELYLAALDWAKRIDSYQSEFYVWRTHSSWIQSQILVQNQEAWTTDSFNHAIDNLSKVIANEEIHQDLRDDALVTRGLIAVLTGDASGQDDVWQGADRWRRRMENGDDKNDFRRRLKALDRQSRRQRYGKAKPFITLMTASNWMEIDQIIQDLFAQAESGKELAQAYAFEAMQSAFSGQLEDCRTAILEHDRLCEDEQCTQSLHFILQTFEQLG